MLELLDIAGLAVCVVLIAVAVKITVALSS